LRRSPPSNPQLTAATRGNRPEFARDHRSDLTMVLEIAQINVKPGLEAEFEAGVAKAQPIFERAKGCKGMELHRSVEKPSRYRLLVKWETLQNHNAA
jgi:hypothetical protein